MTTDTAHQTTKRTAKPQDDRRSGTADAVRRGVTVGDLIRPARLAMIVSGLLTALGALMSIAPFEALRNMAAVWLGEASPEGWRGSLWSAGSAPSCR